MACGCQKKTAAVPTTTAGAPLATGERIRQRVTEPSRARSGRGYGLGVVLLAIVVGVLIARGMR